MARKNLQNQFAENDKEIVKSKPERLRVKRTFETVASPSLQAIVALGFMRKKFVLAANQDLLDVAEHFATLYIGEHDNIKLRSSRGAVLLRDHVLMSALVENLIVAELSVVTDALLRRWAVFLRTGSTPLFEQMSKDGYFSAGMLLSMLKKRYVEYEDRHFQTLKSMATPGACNAINWGILDSFEHEAAQLMFMSPRKRRDEFVTEKHPLLRAFRTTESVDLKREQVRAVISDGDTRPFLAQLESVWQYYAAESKFLKEIGKEAPVADDIRAQNVERVNTWQAQESGKNIPSPQQRFIDIYGRYNHAEMDPLMLAIIARTVGWYMDNKHAQLFTDVRLIPDRKGTTFGGRESIPWAAKAAYPKMKVLKVEDNTFRDSIFGANRMFLTHSCATDATNRESIPIIGLATWRNPAKYRSHQPYALLAADFDQSDGGRGGTKEWKQADHGASFAGVIDQTLCALREVETLEIARANNIGLVRRRYQRWKPAMALEARYGV